MKPLVLSVLLFSPFAFGESSQDQTYIDKFWKASEASIIKSTKTDESYIGIGGVQNYYAHFHFSGNSLENKLVVVTGVEDPVPLWFDVALKARSFGFKDVYIVELRGQGQSDRVPTNDRGLIHVESFDNYSEDLVSALKQIDQTDSLSGGVYFISHSAGSLVLGRSLNRISKNLPNLKIKAASFWSPLFLLKVTPVLNNAIMRPVVSFIERLYRRFLGLLVGKKYQPQSFVDNHLTTDEPKFQMSNAIRFDYGLGSKGISVRWVLEAITAAKNFRRQKINTLSVPSLIIKAGDDQVVRNDYKYKNQNISETTVQDARHALNIEDEKKFAEVLDKTFVFFERFGPE